MITVDTNEHRKRLPKQFRLLSNVRQGEPPQGSTLPTDDQHLLTDGNSANHIFTLFGIVELVHVIN